MPLDSTLLEELGIKDKTWQKSAFTSAYPIGTTTATQERELAELVAFKKLSQQDDVALLARMGLLADPEHPSSIEWRKYTNDCKLTTTIADDPDAPTGFAYGGREIQTFLQGSISNMAFNPDDIQDTFDAIYNAAKDIAKDIRHDKIMTTVEQIKDEFTNGYTISTQSSRKTPKLPKSSAAADQSALAAEHENDEEEDVDYKFIAEMDAITKDRFSTDGIEQLKTDFDAALIFQDHREQLQQILARNIKLERLFIGRLAIALWRAEHNRHFPQLPDEITYLQYVEKIKDRDVDIQSHKKRPIIRAIYRQYVTNEADNESHYCKVLLIPNSDISSAQRSPEKMAENMMFSNDWTVIIQPITLTHTGAGISVKLGSETSNGRSSSIALMRYDDKKAKQIGHERITDIVKEEGREDLRIVYASFCKLVIHYAREELIRRINSGENIDKIFRENTFTIEEGYITALSPLISEESGRKYTSLLGKTVTTKTIHENEAAQLATTQHCLESIALDESLRFSPEDAAEILRRTAKVRSYSRYSNQFSAVTMERLSNQENGLRISHKNYYCNYMVNKIGSMRVEDLDIFNTNKGYFNSGNVRRKEHIVKYIKSSSIDAALKTELAGIFMPINYMHRDGAIRTNLISFRNKHHHELSDEILKLINLYIDIESYFDVAKVRKQIRTASADMVTRLVTRVQGAFGIDVDPLEQRELERIATSYITARKDQKICEILGIRAHVTCKSGVDRTGLYQAFVEAMSAIDMDALALENDAQNRMPDAAQLEENILRSLQHSLHITVKRHNLAGIAGLQINPATLKNMHLVSAFLAESMLDKIGKSGKAMYEVPNDTIISQVILSDANTAATAGSLRSPRALVYSPQSSVPAAAVTATSSTPAWQQHARSSPTLRPPGALPKRPPPLPPKPQLPPLPSNIQLKQPLGKPPVVQDSYQRILQKAREDLKPTTTTPHPPKRHPKHKKREDQGGTGDAGSDG